MNEAEAAEIHATLSSTFNHEADDAEMVMWYESALRNLPYIDGQKVAARIIAQDKFWPTPARFNEIRRAMFDLKVTRQVEIPDDGPVTLRSVNASFVSRDEDRPALQAGPKTQEERDNVARFIRSCREIVATRDKRPHWHGGPEPCWCGGINPNWRIESKKKLQDAAKGMTNPNNPTGERYGRPAPWNCQTVEPIILTKDVGR